MKANDIRFIRINAENIELQVYNHYYMLDQGVWISVKL